MDDERILQAIAAHLGEPSTFDHDLLTFLHKHGSPLEIWMYMSVLWPKTCEVDGMVFFTELGTVDVTPEEIHRLLVRCDHDRSEVEKRVNYVEVAYLFGSRRGEASDEMDTALAERLVTIWAARLDAEYPDRAFVVETLLPEETGDEVAIVVYQRRTRA